MATGTRGYRRVARRMCNLLAAIEGGGGSRRGCVPAASHDAMCAGRRVRLESSRQVPYTMSLNCTTDVGLGCPWGQRVASADSLAE